MADNNYLAVTLAGDFIKLDFDNLLALANKELVTSSDLYKNLRSKGFLFDSLSKYSIELAAIRLRTRMAHVFHLTSLHMFVISLRCDHSCPYCQVSRQNQTANNIFDMTESVADKALDVVFDSPSKNIKIEFQGGEPLLNFELVKHIVTRAIQINESKNRNLDFVIATNETHSVREFLVEIFGYLDLDWQRYVEIDERYFRPTEVESLLGDPSKAKNELGWEPKITFDELVKEMVLSDMEEAKRDALVEKHGFKSFNYHE